MAIIVDPVYGFTDIPRGLLREIIDHPYFQRLDRIHQLGMSVFVYPSAQHTRKQHSIGAYHLTTEALKGLVEKGHYIFDSEIEATQAAILMHDLGHGPYSHVLEKTFVKGISHEEISLLLMERINEDLRGELALAIKIFCNDYPKPFLHELLSSQLDMDRLDYLCRDSFYTGVREGNVGAERIIKMLDVREDKLVVQHKGIYSVENYLMARRLMYWQVYLHKTTVAAEEVLRSALRRAKELAAAGENLFGSPALRYFLYNDVTAEVFRTSEICLDHYVALDDTDLLCALKVWAKADDKILSTLSSCFIHRQLFKADVSDLPFDETRTAVYREAIATALELPPEATDYFVKTRSVANEMYSKTAEGIGLLFPDEQVRELSEVSHIVRNEEVGLQDRKHYLFYLRV